MSGYGKGDAARDTGSSSGEVSKAWHAARDDAAASGELSERNASKTSDTESGGFLNFLSRLAGFGGGDDSDPKTGSDVGSFG